MSFIERYSHFFRTRTRDNAEVARAYLQGLAQAEDCTFESMATVVENGCAQRFQHFMSESRWDHEPVVAQIIRDADALLGGKPDSALIIVRHGRLSGAELAILASSHDDGDDGDVVHRRTAHGRVAGSGIANALSP